MMIKGGKNEGSNWFFEKGKKWVKIGGLQYDWSLILHSFLFSDYKIQNWRFSS